MRIIKPEEHLYFSSGFKKFCLVLKDYIQCGSGPRAFARTWLSTPSTGRKIHLCREAGGQARGHSFTGPQDGSPVPSCVSHLHHSGQQLASCQQGAHQILTPLLSCQAASGTWSRLRGWEEKTRKLLPHSHLTTNTSPFPGVPIASVANGRLVTMSHLILPSQCLTQ